MEDVFAAARNDGWREPTAETGAVVEVQSKWDHRERVGHRGGGGGPGVYSWEEFIVEVPAKRNGRRRPLPASASLFEWALDLEQEPEMVGAGR